MSKILITQEVTPETLFKWVGIVKTIFKAYNILTNNGKENAIEALHFPVETIYRKMSFYFYKRKIKKSLCEFSIEERNIEVTIKGYCSWYFFKNAEENFSFDVMEGKEGKIDKFKLTDNDNREGGEQCDEKRG